MRIAITVLALLFLTLPLSAQQWTAEEQAVLDTIRLCWDAWQEAVEKQDFEVWVSKCPMEEDYSMWWTNLGAPIDLEADRRNADHYLSLRERWLAIQPVAVRIHGDTAIVQFYGIWLPLVDGKRVTSEYKRTEVFIKRNGQWRFIGGQGTPVSEAASAPYN